MAEELSWPETQRAGGWEQGPRGKWTTGAEKGGPKAFIKSGSAGGTLGRWGGHGRPTPGVGAGNALPPQAYQSRKPDWGAGPQGVSMWELGEWGCIVLIPGRWPWNPLSEAGLSPPLVWRQRSLARLHHLPPGTGGGIPGLCVVILRPEGSCPVLQVWPFRLLQRHRGEMQGYCLAAE